jgi:hypothetical protein
MAMGEAYVTRFSVGRLLPKVPLAALVLGNGCPCGAFVEMLEALVLESGLLQLVTARPRRASAVEGAVERLYTGLLNDVYRGASWPAGGIRHIRRL